jgi:hypothetical protein
LPKWPENCFEPFGKGGWPLISTWIIKAKAFGLISEKVKEWSFVRASIKLREHQESIVSTTNENVDIYIVN